MTMKGIKQGVCLKGQALEKLLETWTEISTLEVGGRICYVILEVSIKLASLMSKNISYKKVYNFSMLGVAVAERPNV